ncbi:MAG: YraN family protein [Holosporales bacterium]|jgi:putative endonuclease|nr:YraN family protein [Holosporales bacterium]
MSCATVPGQSKLASFHRQVIGSANRNSYQKGIASEQRAVDFLQAHGHTVLKRRYRTEFGEIDIISVKDSIVHAIEVKERQTVREARFAISINQRSRIAKSLDVFLQTQCVPFKDVQLDAIFITRNNLCFLENAWYVEDCAGF